MQQDEHQSTSTAWACCSPAKCAVTLTCNAPIMQHEGSIQATPAAVVGGQAEVAPACYHQARNMLALHRGGNTVRDGSRVVGGLHKALACLVSTGIVVEGDECKAAVECWVVLVHHQLHQLHTCRTPGGNSKPTPASEPKTLLQR